MPELGQGGGEVIGAMSERKRFLSVDVFPKKTSNNLKLEQRKLNSEKSFEEGNNSRNSEHFVSTIQ